MAQYGSGTGTGYLPQTIHAIHPANEHPMPQVSYRNNTQRVPGVVFHLRLSRRICRCYDDPLHPRFHERIKKIKKGRGTRGAFRTKCSAELHPTENTVRCVRRASVLPLGGLIKHVERSAKRCLSGYRPNILPKWRRQEDCRPRTLSD